MKIMRVAAEPLDGKDEVGDESDGVDEGDGVNGGEATDDVKSKDEKHGAKEKDEKLGLSFGETSDVEKLGEAKGVDADDVVWGPD